MERWRLAIRTADSLKGFMRYQKLIAAMGQLVATRAASRQFWMQVALVAVLVLAVWWLMGNVASNLQRQNIASGFDFLGERAGFGISQTLVDYTEDHSYGRVLFVGLLNTLLVSILGIFCASLLGFMLGVARLSHNWLVAQLAAIYIELFRNVPLLLQIMFWYFGVLRQLPAPRQAFAPVEGVFLSNRGIKLPALELASGSFWYGLAIALLLGAFYYLRRRSQQARIATGYRRPIFRPLALLAGLVLALAMVLGGLPFSVDMPELRGFNFRGGLTIIPEFAALTLALSLYTAAFIAEIVRAGIMSVDKGQHEAATALGLPESQALRLIIIPQALRVIIPPLTSQYLNLTKNSSLAVAIAYPDIVSVFAGTSLTQVGQAVEIIFITMMIYLTLSLLTSWLMNNYNRRIALVEQGHE